MLFILPLTIFIRGCEKKIEIKGDENMAIKCKKCGIELGEEEPQQNGMCIDCFVDEWGELVEKSPITCPRDLLYVHE
jgi:hypothetical protein